MTACINIAHFYLLNYIHSKTIYFPVMLFLTVSGVATLWMLYNQKKNRQSVSQYYLKTVRCALIYSAKRQSGLHWKDLEHRPSRSLCCWNWCKINCLAIFPWASAISFLFSHLCASWLICRSYFEYCFKPLIVIKYLKWDWTHNG